MEASVKTVWDGWKHLRTPDNIEVTLSFDDGEPVDVFVSVLDLVELYNHVVEQEPRDVMVGTGDIVETEFRDDRVTVVLNEQYEENLSYEGLKGMFEDLFREVFTELDAVGAARSRQQEFEHHEAVADLYERFSGQVGGSK